MQEPSPSLERLARLYGVPVATAMKWQQAGHGDLRPAVPGRGAVRALRPEPSPPPPESPASRNVDPQRPWLKVSALAAQQNVDRRTIWRWAGVGIVEVSRLDRRVGVRVRLAR